MLRMGLWGLLFSAMVFDWRARRIPNWLNLGVFVLCASVLGLGDAIYWREVLTLFALCALLLGGLFYRGLLGGGDVKLVLALVPIMRLVEFPVFVGSVLVLGGGVALVVGRFQRQVSDQPMTVPYALAIVPACWPFSTLWL